VKNTEADFWARVDKSGDCWIWRGTMHHGGYGLMWFQGYQWSTHRLAYKLTHGAIPDGLFVCHHCDVRACVNPAHLYAGTVQDNNRDKIVRGRARHGNLDKLTHCKHGHLFDEVNTLWSYNTGGRRRRSCRACMRIRYHRSKEISRMRSSA
jgi:hypothetical protein